MSELVSDGIPEVVDAADKAVFMELVRVADAAISRRREAARKAEREAADAVKGARAQFNAEVAISDAKLKPVLGEKWWDAVTLNEVRVKYAEARAWDGVSPLFGVYADRLEDKALERFDVRLDREWDEAKISQGIRDRPPMEAAKVRREAPVLGPDTEKVPKVSKESKVSPEGPVRDAPAGWDSPARRAEKEARLKGAGVDPEAVAAEMAADLNTGRSPGVVPGAAPKKKPSAGRTAQEIHQVRQAAMNRDPGEGLER